MFSRFVLFGDVHATLRRPQLAVTAAGTGVVSHAGAGLLADLAVAVAVDGECLSDIATLADQ